MLSVIVPVYNSKLYLNTLIDSILNQTYFDLELILVDDGSTDGSADICDRRSLEDERITVIHKENGGQSSARNEGLLFAKGEYITFADNDDFVHPEMYATLMEIIKKENVDVCACGFLNVLDSEFDDLNLTLPPCSYRRYSAEELVNDYFKPTWKIPVWNKIYKKQVVDELRFEEVHLGEDNLFSYQVICNAKSYCYIDQVMYFQRMHGNNYEFTATEYMIDLLLCKEKVLKDIKKNYSSLFPNLQIQFLNECIRTYNLYNDSARKRAQVLNIFKRNSTYFMFRKISIGHKVLFLKLNMTKENKLPIKIII